jgi:hypothetical protein
VSTRARLILTVRSASGRLFRRAAIVKSRRFTVVLKLRYPRGRVVARFAGDPTFRPASASTRTRR